MPDLCEAIRPLHLQRGQSSTRAKLRDPNDHQNQAKVGHLSGEQELTVDSLRYFHRFFLSQLHDIYALYANLALYLSQ